MINEEETKELIALIDPLHGNELKHRTERDIDKEVAKIQEFIKRKSRERYLSRFGT